MSTWNNNTYSNVMCIGFYRLCVGGNNVLLTDVLFVPFIRRNLISISALNGKGFEVKFVSGKVIVEK